jgi:putative ABC transport system permease protein
VGWMTSRLSIEQIARDFRYACRSLRRDAGLAAAAIVILAIGICANTAVFSLIRPVLLEPLPFDRPEQLAWISNTGTTGLSGATFQVDTFEGLRKATSSFTDWASYFAFSDYGNNTLVDHGNAERVAVMETGPNFFQLLGIRPALGRLFTSQEALPNGGQVVLVSHDYWQRRFGARPEVVGSYVTINDQPTLVAGVLPASFDFPSVFAPGTRADLFTPAIFDELRHEGNTLALIARLAPGATIAGANAELDVVRRALGRSNPSLYPFGTRVSSLQDHVSGTMRRPLYVLWGAVALVLLIVCANVSNLLLARSTTRTKEFAVRLALGASRRRIFQQLALEGMVLALLGAAIGVPLAYALTESIKQGVTLAVPLLHRATVDPVALAVTALISLGTALIFSVLPALRLARIDPQAALVDQTRGTTAGRRHTWVRTALVVSEIAMASVLLIGAGLLARSLLHLLDANLGFRPGQASVMTLNVTSDRPDLTTRLTEAARRIRAVPGVTAAGLTDALPLDRNRSWGLAVPGQIYRPGERPLGFVYIVSPGYLDAMGMSLQAGRNLADTDSADRPPVVVLSQSLARQLYPGQDPVGRPVQIFGGPPHTIVGIVADVRQSRLDVSSAPQMYLPFAQGGGRPSDLVVRSTASIASLVPSVRRELAGLDPTLLVTDVRPVSDLVDRSASPRRLLASLLGGFSLFALLLASLGIYGVVSYDVSQRTQEIGVRMALGATGSDVRRHVLSGTMRIALLGTSIGLVGAFGLSRLIGSLLFDTSPADPVTFGSTAALLLGVAAVAGFLPALRASRIAPMRAIQG